MICCALQVVLVHDPRPHNPYGHLYTVEYLNNMVNSPLVLYINQPASELKRLALESIKAGEVRVNSFSHSFDLYCRL
jgi:aminopeptidase C